MIKIKVLENLQPLLGLSVTAPISCEKIKELMTKRPEIVGDSDIEIQFYLYVKDDMCYAIAHFDVDANARVENDDINITTDLTPLAHFIKVD